MDRPRNISSGEAMRWNEDVERRRRECHEQRCAENALYRRAYERQQEQRRRLNEMIGKNMVQLAAMHTDCMQRASSITEDACCQQVKTHEEVMREQALMDSMSKNPTEWFAHSTGFGLGSHDVCRPREDAAAHEGNGGGTSVPRRNQPNRRAV